MRRRSRELLLLLVTGLAVTSASFAAYVAQSHVVDAGSLLWGLSMLAMLLIVHVALRHIAPEADPYLLPAVGVLSGLGVMMINRLRPDLAGKQVLWIVIGIIAMLVVLWKIPDHRAMHRRVDPYRNPFGIAAVVLLLITISPLGSTINGAHLWLRMGPVSIQPGEFAKLLMVIFLAAYLGDPYTRLHLSQWADEWRGLLRKLRPMLLFWSASLVLLVLMNDFGTSLLFYGTFLLMVYVATARLWYLMVGAAVFIAGSAAVVQVAGHVRERFDIWLDPWKDPQGSGYQLLQGLYAMADGGLFGRGFGQAVLVLKPKVTLIPAAHTDFIFAAIADEAGFIGSVGVLLVYVVIAWRGYAIAARSSNSFSKLLAFGLATTFALQTIIIVGGVVRLLPLTGQTLPFLSYGGSSVLANSVLVALLLVASHHANSEADDALGTARGASS